MHFRIFKTQINVLFRASLLKTKCSRKLKWNHDEVREAVKAIPLNHKRTLRDLSTALGIPLTTLHQMKDGDDRVIMPCTIALKPALTDIHKIARVLFACSKIDPIDLHFCDFYDYVHIDEKWFFISEKALRLYIAVDEDLPDRTCKNKDHILKVMFLSWQLQGLVLTLMKIALLMARLVCFPLLITFLQDVIAFIVQEEQWGPRHSV